METENNHTEEQRRSDAAEQPVAAAAPMARPVAANDAPKAGRKGSRGFKLLVLLVLVVVAIGWSWWLFGRSTSYDENQAINTSEYQAVFLTNGQVYFGKLADLNNKYVTLTSIYYLQVQQSDGSLQNASGNTTSSQVSLAKLGSELHGPQDKMSISSDQMLFWENLKSDSKVVKAIEAYQNK
jgi:uncharacterized protein HemX